MGLYVVHSGTAAGAANQAPVATGTAIKTLLQVAVPAGINARLTEFSISFDAAAAAQAVIVEVLSTTGAATVTAANPTPYGSPGGPASLCVGGTTATGHSASGEGTPGTCRVALSEHVSPTTGYTYQWVFGREFVVAASTFCRVRVKAAATVNALTRLVWEEV